MGASAAFIAVIILVLIALVGAGAANLHLLFGVIIPYLAFATFIIGVVYRVIKWGRSPVPFRIPTTAGQQNSLPWIKQNKLDNPSTTLGVIGRMGLEVLIFRSLFRNTRSELYNGSAFAHRWEKWLWIGSLAFHWSFLIVLVRHFRLFTEPALPFLHLIEAFDGFMQIGTPGLFISGLVLLGAASYLLFRRFYIPQVKYISLTSDYFPLFLIIAIAVSGILMRYFIKTDIVSAKELIMGLLTFNLIIPKGIGVIFYIHVFLVSALFAYFPFSKLVHMAGVFLSPTRNLANNSRMKRHINPWNYPVKVHTYEEYEDDFRAKMKSADIPVEKE
ncbi:MAG: sulfate reduction electron transfer complex DsrMKJOP subunit DsrM [Nitrospirota bacterium]